MQWTKKLTLVLPVLPIIEVWSCAQLPVVTSETVNCGILRSALRATGIFLFHSRISSLVVFETAINIKRKMISECYITNWTKVPSNLIGRFLSELEATALWSEFWNVVQKEHIFIINNKSLVWLKTVKTSVLYTRSYKKSNEFCAFVSWQIWLSWQYWKLFNFA